MNRDTGAQGTASLVAGTALAVIAVLAAFGNLVAIEPRIIAGDPARTVQAIAAAEMLFGAGIVSLSSWLCSTSSSPLRCRGCSSR